MATLQCRTSIALATVVVALFWSGPAAVHAGPPHGHGGLSNNLVTGASFEILDQSVAERKLDHLEAKYQRAVAQSNAAAAERNAWRIHKTRYRIGVDQWLIRYNSCQQLGPYPDPLCLDPMTRAAIGQYRRPSFGP